VRVGVRAGVRVGVRVGVRDPYHPTPITRPLSPDPYHLLVERCVVDVTRT